MRASKLICRRAVLPALLALAALLAACRASPLATLPEAPAGAVPTLMPTAALPPPAAAATSAIQAAPPPALPATFTPVAATPAARPATATPLPPASLASPTATPTATPDAADPVAAVAEEPPAGPAPAATTAARACPDPPPLKPDYVRFYLSGRPWPQPDPAVEAPHFWLAKPLPGGGRFLINPTFPYGWDLDGRLLLHNGVDAAEPLGTPLLATADGTVVVAQSDASAWFGWRCDWYGHLVIIEHDFRWQGQPVYSLYGHVLNILVTPGQQVRQGDPVAEVGFGGAASAPHLHFEVRVGANDFGSTRNPMLWITPGETRGVVVGRLVDPEGRPWQGVPLNLVDADGEVAATTWSYLDDPDHTIKPDEGLAENFVFADVSPGPYRIVTRIQGAEYQVPVTVAGGSLARAVVATGPFRESTPTPPATEAP